VSIPGTIVKTSVRPPSVRSVNERTSTGDEASMFVTRPTAWARPPGWSALGDADAAGAGVANTPARARSTKPVAKPMAIHIGMIRRPDA
jgi:hypothetical protein